MNITIYKFINITELLIYEFSYNGKVFSYTGFMISRRNDKNDIWGHKWSDHFTKQKYKELAEYEELHDYYPDGYDFNPLDEGYNDIHKKYNPVLHKTNSGKVYLEGSFSAQSRKLPKPEFTEEELLEKLKKEVAKKMKKATLKL